MFANNRKKFFRNRKEQISVEKLPKKEALETFWCSILKNNREYNPVEVLNVITVLNVIKS